MKGRSGPLLLREVLGLPTLGQVVPRLERRCSPRVATCLPLLYRRLDGKTVLPTVSSGTACDLGYHGALVDVGEPLPLYSELKVDLSLLPAGERADDLYARVVNSRGAGSGHRVGLEFTSLSADSARKIRRLVQWLLQQPAVGVAGVPAGG